MGYLGFGVVMGFIVSWLHMAQLLRDGETFNLPRTFLENPLHPVMSPFAIVYQLVRGDVPRLRAMFLWTVVIYSAAAWLAAADFHKVLG